MNFLSRSVAFWFVASLNSPAFAQAPSPAPTPLPEATRNSNLRLGLKVDCTHNFSINKGAKQECLSLTGLRATFEDHPAPKASFRIQLDPFATPVAQRSEQVRLGDFTQPENSDSPLGVVSDYQFSWQFRQNLALSIENFDGATAIPNASRLSLAQEYVEDGWQQMALVARYHLNPLQGVDIVIAFGNGEGEQTKNLDPQQYGAIRIEAGLIPGLKFIFGGSFDGNTNGSYATTWLYQGQDPTMAKPRGGFSTERYGAALHLTGELPQARGLEAVVGWQRVRYNDLDKDIPGISESVFTDPKRPIDPNYVMVEVRDNSEANSTERNTFNVGASYLILDTYRIGFDYENRQVDTGKVSFFEACSDIVDDKCATPGNFGSKLAQTAYTVGVAAALDEGLLFTVDYRSEDFAKLYHYFSYEGIDGKRVKSRELFNARISYNW